MRTKLRLFVTALLLTAGVLAAVLAASGASADTTTTTTSSTTSSNTTSTNTSSSSTTSSGSSTTSSSSTTGAPSVQTQAGSAVTTYGVTLNGTVNPNGQSTTCYFQFGPTSAYGLQTAPQTVTPLSTGAAQSVSAKLTALQPRAVFHDRLVCTSSLGTTSGGDMTFTTADRGPSTLRLSGHTAFVSFTGSVGVIIGCYGDRTCVSSLKLTRDGVVIAQRNAFIIAPQQSGIVHLTLNASGRAAMRRYGVITVGVSGSTSQGQTLQGGDAGLRLGLHLFR